MTSAKLPYVVCHMVPSIDGRIVIDDWKVPKGLHAAYEETAATFGANAWIIGRISMEPYAGKAKIPARRARERIPRTDFVAPHDASAFAIAIDPSGKLRWRKSSIDHEHVVTILGEGVSDAYLAFLRDRGVSYLFGGKTRIDLKRVLVKLRRYFGIEKLLLEGGGKINGSFLAVDLIDELSVLIAPVADGTIGAPTLFDAEHARPRTWKLTSMERRDGDLVWLRYRRR